MFAPGLVLLASLWPAPDDPPAFARQLPPEATGPVRFAFNGKDLDGFYPYTKAHKRADPDKVFSVAEGMIRITGTDFGALTTNDSFEDYHLTVEWKWGKPTHAPRETKARDSGILLHAVGADGVAAGSWMESVECQLIEGGCGDFILIGGKGQPAMTFEVRRDGDQLYWHPGGESTRREGGRINWWGRDPAWKDDVDYRGPRDVEAPFGEWNRSEVRCDGDAVINIVNGLVVAAGTGSTHRSGRIQLQSEGAELWIRKFEIRALK